MNPTDRPDVWLSRFAKLVVLMTFVLIFVGGHTTTSGAGMAFADWPLSDNSVNPTGWWTNFMQRLEHSHRLTAETVGLLVGILCAWVWRAKWAVPTALGVSVVLAVSAHFAGQPRPMIAHIGLWSAAVVFTLMILARLSRVDHVCSGRIRWLAFVAFLGVLAQAILGGLRVTIESGGDADTATIFRVVHGCFAQFELCLLVIIAAMLSPAWTGIAANRQMRAVHRIGWVTTVAVFLQLIVGATMRHLGAGLAITTFPRLPDGSWMPREHNKFIDLNFTHTRFGAALVAILILCLALRAVGSAAGDVRIIRPSALLLALTVAQVIMGMTIIWQMRQPLTLTTQHVVNGAAVLATTVLLTVRAGRAAAVHAETARVATVTV